jgi:hypothetical protein
MRITILAALAAVASCASPSANQMSDNKASGGPATAGPAPGNAVNKQEIRVECDAEPANFALGEPYSPALAERARTTSGALTVVRLVPGRVPLLESVGSRLSLEVDAGNRVTGVVCG